MKISLKKKIQRRDLLIGTIVTLPCPEIAEILSLKGFDWLFVDLEHSALNIRDAQAIIQAAAPKTPCVIRVPTHDEAWIKKCLDIGASGIIVPQIRTPECAAQAIRHCKYPPEGSRSVGIARAQGYGAGFRDYVTSANDDIAVILQIEHIDGVENIEEICSLSGIDALFVGPYDLSASMGNTGLTTHPDVQDAILRVKQGADRADIPVGIFGISEETLKPYIEKGFTLIVSGIDTLIFGEAAASILHPLKE